MAAMKEAIKYAGGLLSDGQAMRLGRAAFAMALLGDGCVAMVGIFDHKRAVGLYGPGSPDPDFDLRIDVTSSVLPTGAEIDQILERKAKS